MKWFAIFACLLVAAPAWAEEEIHCFEHLRNGQHEQAIQCARDKMDKGDPYGWYFMGYLYMRGEGVEQDYSVAYDYFMTSLDKGCYYAFLNLGRMYKEGLGVPQNYEKAAVCYSYLAENKGSIIAMYELGKLFRDGHGVPVDYVKAHMYFNIVASRWDEYNAPKFRKERDALAEKMTPEQIQEAQNLAAEWWNKDNAARREPTAP